MARATEPRKVPKGIREIPIVEEAEIEFDTFKQQLGIWIICIDILVFLIVLGEDVFTTFAQILLAFVFALGIYFLCFSKFVNKKRLERKIVMEQNEIVHNWPFKLTTRNSYEAWAESIGEGHYKIGRRGFEAWLGVERITFFYNVGLANERKKSCERYRQFKLKITEANPMVGNAMPDYTTETVDLLDKRCFYHRSRRQQFIVQSVNLVAFLFLGVIGGVKGAVITSLISGSIEALVLFNLYKGGYYYYKNELKLKEALPEVKGITTEDGIGALRPYYGFIFATLVFIASYAFEIITIWW